MPMFWQSSQHILLLAQWRREVWSKHLTNHKGYASSKPHDMVHHMLQFYEQLHERGIPVSSQLLAIELQRLSPKLNHVDVATLRLQVLCIMKKTTLLTAVLLIRPKMSTMSSILLMTSSFMWIGRLLQADTLLMWLLTWMRPMWTLTLHQGPCYAGSGNGQWMHVSVGIQVAAQWYLHAQWAELNYPHW